MDGSSKSRWAVVLSWLAAMIPFVGFWSYGLTDLDEGFYGAVVTDMLRRHDWITPTFNGVPWFEKPILSYWLAMPTVALFGNEFGARLPSVLCTLATAAVMARFARRHFSDGVALVLPAAYTGCLLVGGVGRMMMTDPALVLCLTLAFTTFFQSLTGEPKARLWTAFWLGLAVLAKGPVALVLFAVLGTCTYWKCPDLRTNFRGHWAWGTLIVVAVAATWYVPCYLANGDSFVQKFLIEQNVGRFAGGDKAHAVPLWSHPVYFPAVMLLALFPWVIWSSKAVVAKLRDKERGNAFTYLWLWGLVVVGFFTISGSKLPHYALPAVAPWLTLALVAVVKEADALKRWLPLAAGWCCVTLALAQGLTQDYYNDNFADVQRVTREVARRSLPIVLFRITGGGSNDWGIHDTSHPSQLFYLRRVVTVTDDMTALAIGTEPKTVMTRDGGMDVETVTYLFDQGWEVKPIDLTTDSKDYRVFRVSPRSLKG